MRRFFSMIVVLAAFSVVSHGSAHGGCLAKLFGCHRGGGECASGMCYGQYGGETCASGACAQGQCGPSGCCPQACSPAVSYAAPAAPASTAALPVLNPWSSVDPPVPVSASYREVSLQNMDVRVTNLETEMSKVLSKLQQNQASLDQIKATTARMDAWLASHP